MKEQMIRDFVVFLREHAPVELTVTKIRKDFFNNNNDFASKVLKWLKEEGFVMSNQSWCLGKGQIWTDLKTDKDLDVAIGNSALCSRKKNTASCRKIDDENTASCRKTVEEENTASCRKTVEEENTASCRTFKVNYRGFKEVDIRCSKDDFTIVNKVKDELGELISEDLFIDYLIAYGFEKEKAWFYYQKVKKS